MRIKKVVAILLTAMVVLQTLCAIPVTAVESEGTIITDMINKEGLWLTEIYPNDADRSTTNNARESKGYESIQLFNETGELMEFIEVSSSHTDPISLNDTYEIYYGSTKLTIQDMKGNSNITVNSGQSVVLWHYRDNLAVVPTEAQFRKEMRVPDDALLLKIVGHDTGWNGDSCTFSIKRKSDGKVISTFNAVKGTTIDDGFSVDLKIPHIGSTMEVYHQMNIPSAGYTYSGQLNWLVDAYVPANRTGTGVYITEIRPHDDNRNSTYGTTSNVMECFEIYNASSETIDLNNDYTVMYVVKEGSRKILQFHKYKSTAEDAMGATTGCTVAPGQVAVLWCNRKGTLTDYNSYPTLTQFRTAMGMAEDVPVYVFNNQESMNNVNRGIELYKNNSDGTRTLESSYCYIGGGVDLAAGTSVHLQVNPERPEMWVYEANTASTIGTVKKAQYTHQDDNSEVSIALDDKLPYSIKQGDELRVNFAFALTGALARKNITTYYRCDGKGSWKSITETKRITPGIYDMVIPADELFDATYVEFYVCTQNKYRQVLSDVYKVMIDHMNDVDGIQTNVEDGQVLKGTYSITANDGTANANTKIYIDGTKQTTQPMLDDGGYFIFNAYDRDPYFCNALTTTKDKLIADLGYWRNAILDKQAIRIDNSYFTYSSSAKTYTVTLRFRSGTMGSFTTDPLDPSANKDDFRVTGMQMKLPNGKTYLPTSIGPTDAATKDKTNTSTALDAIHCVGDSSKWSPYMDVTFKLPSTDLNAVGYKLDTTKLADGQHTLKVTNGTHTKNVTFIVDNTNPTINAGITNNSTVTGNITLNPTVTDANTLTDVVVLLDGKAIETPYSTTAYDLKEGSHTLKVTAKDIAGNSSTSTINFKVSGLSIPLNDAGSENVTYNSADLYLTLGDTSTKAEATFYQVEPVDTQQITTNKSGGILPYIEYKVNVGNVADNDVIMANWDGTASNSDSAHATKMFVLNTATGKWDTVAKVDASGFIKNGSFVAKDHVKDGVATIIVQCTENSSLPDIDTEFATTSGMTWDGTGMPSSYDFAFAWETDTQYYVEEYQYHVENMNHWIADNAEKYKIKYVIHTGDIVDDHNRIYQWENASKAMKILEDADIPYGVLGGNHDVASGLGIYDNYHKYFGADRFEDQPYYGESHNNNAGHYDIISENGQDFIIVYMSWNMFEEEVAWMNKVLAEHSDKKAILCFHGYTRGSYSDDGNLRDYFTDIIQDSVVAKNPNVFAVLNGHYHGSSYQITKYDDNGDGKKERTVYQICTDYQKGGEGGMGYIKMIYFDLKNNKIYMNAYSPSINDFNFFDASVATITTDGSTGVDVDPMLLKLTFNSTAESIVANSFEAYVRKGEALGTAELNTSNGEIALSVDGLAPETEYLWCAEITNANTAQMVSNIYEFTTGKAPVIIYGDSNGSGKVEISDVTTIQKIAAKLITATEEQKIVCDVDGNGKLNIRDALYIQKKLASLIDKFPVEQ